MMDVASPKKGPKMPKKHEKVRGHGNQLPKGVLVKFSSIQGRHQNAHCTIKRIRLEMSGCIFLRMLDVMSVISMYRVI